MATRLDDAEREAQPGWVGRIRDSLLDRSDGVLGHNQDVLDAAVEAEAWGEELGVWFGQAFPDDALQSHAPVVDHEVRDGADVWTPTDEQLPEGVTLADVDEPRSLPTTVDGYAFRFVLSAADSQRGRAVARQFDDVFAEWGADGGRMTVSAESLPAILARLRELALLRDLADEIAATRGVSPAVDHLAVDEYGWSQSAWATATDRNPSTVSRTLDR